ncbi:MAG: lysine exporter LysO family protein [Alistipes sp.]|nr:lysine exporter LysO family protein [Alistipes sp.]MBQ5719900.1 lysine exporter LysO family protein [Alistipes sp.]MBQ5831127.1 lysine exporter LysO family protein [Alistipes sp.]
MRSSFIIIAAFVVGVVAAVSELLPTWLTDGSVAMWVLYALMLQVGIGIGSDPRLKEILRSLSPRLLLLPCATIVGTMVASAAVSLLISRWSVAEVMAAGSGMGYYSLSSILITQLKEPTVGAVVAAELGTVALVANILREMLTLTLAPLMVRWFSPVAPICSGGATTMDVTLPVITQYAGREWVFVAIVHGVVVDFSVPFWVSLFCAL